MVKQTTFGSKNITKNVIKEFRLYATKYFVTPSTDFLASLFLSCLVSSLRWLMNIGTEEVWLFAAFCLKFCWL